MEGWGRGERKLLAPSELGFSRGVYDTMATVFALLVVAAHSQFPSSSFPSLLFLLPSSFKKISLSLCHSSPALLVHISDSEWGMANTMVSLCSSELGPLGWDAVTKRQLFLQKVSSKLGPSPRPQGRGTRADRGPSGPAPGSGTGPPGQGSPGPRQAQTDGSTLGKGGPSAGSGAPTTKSQGESVQCLLSEHIPERHTHTQQRPNMQ